ncbi:MAG: hypothetical protein Kow0069_35580 [Promethearchaeota archaeon]
MVSDKLFPRGEKSKKKKQAAQIAKIQQTIRRIEVNSKKFQRRSDLFRLQARKALKEGNRALARNKLVRWKVYRLRLEKYQNFVAQLERRLDAITDGGIIQEFGRAMETAGRVLEGVAKEISPEKAAQITEGSEEAIAKIEDASDILAGDPEEEYELGIEEELEKLETELLLEDAGEMPATPQGVPDEAALAAELDGDDEILDEKEKLKKELERLKEELG